MHGWRQRCHAAAMPSTATAPTAVATPCLIRVWFCPAQSGARPSSIVACTSVLNTGTPQLDPSTAEAVGTNRSQTATASPSATTTRTSLRMARPYAALPSI